MIFVWLGCYWGAFDLFALLETTLDLDEATVADAGLDLTALRLQMLRVSVGGDHLDIDLVTLKLKCALGNS